MSDQIIDIDEHGNWTFPKKDCCRAAVQAEREKREKLRLVLHNTVCQEYDDCVDACREASNDYVAEAASKESRK